MLFQKPATRTAAKLPIVRQTLALATVLGSAVALIAAPIPAAAASRASAQAPEVSQATPHWTTIKSPSVTGTVVTALNGIGCASSDFCVAAGRYATGGGSGSQALIEQWNGTKWTIAKAPTGARTYNGLRAVNCASQTFCMAVGDTETYSGSPNSFAEAWNGHTWSTTNTQALEHDIALAGVSCVGTTFCVAVGNGGVDFADTMIALWNGSGWSEMPSPTLNDGDDDMTLNGINCASTTFCIAVGTYDDPNGTGTAQTLIEEWSGASWSIVASPNTGSALDNELYAVKCASAALCMAVGEVFDGTTFDTLIEEWNGANWILLSTGSQPGTLASISCVATSFCMAMGSVVDVWNGTSWTLTSAPANAAGLTSIKCSSTTLCLSVGTAASQATAALWNGTAWTAPPVPSVTGSLNVQLNAVSCIGTTFCVLVGEQDQFGPHSGPLIEDWNGSVLSVMKSPGGPSNYLNSVRCASTTFCTAVGFGRPSSTGHNQTLIEQWNGKNWSVVASPDANATADNVLQSVACASATFCFAVGDVADASTDDYETLVERWNGATWTIVASPNVSGVQGSALSSVSCVSAAFCVAVGDDFFSPPNQEQTLVEEWQGTGWSIVPSPNPSNGGQLASVDCASTSFCITVGFTGGSQSLGEMWNGSVWSTISLPSSVWGSVRCVGTAFCMAVGNYNAAMWNGKTWSNVSLPSISASQEGELTGLGCTSTVFCIAAGYLTDSAGTHGLAMKW